MTSSAFSAAAASATGPGAGAAGGVADPGVGNSLELFLNTRYSLLYSCRNRAFFDPSFDSISDDCTFVDGGNLSNLSNAGVGPCEENLNNGFLD